MSFADFLVLVVLPSGIVGAIVAGVMTHFSNKKLDAYRRMMDVRKDTYTQLNELLSALYDTVTDEETKKSRSGVLKFYREVQLWGSDEVLKRFQEFLYAVDIKNGVNQEKRNLAYKTFVVAMRRDMLGETKVTPEEIQVHGLIN